MKEQTMKETTLKVKNQTTTLQKAIILGDIVFMIGSFSVFLCNLLISYILYRNEGKEGAEKWKMPDRCKYIVLCAKAVHSVPVGTDVYQGRVPPSCLCGEP